MNRAPVVLTKRAVQILGRSEYEPPAACHAACQHADLHTAVTMGRCRRCQSEGAQKERACRQTVFPIHVENSPVVMTISASVTMTLRGDLLEQATCIRQLRVYALQTGAIW